MKSKSSITTRKAKPELQPLIMPGEYLVEEFLEPLKLVHQRARHRAACSGKADAGDREGRARHYGRQGFAPLAILRNDAGVLDQPDYDLDKARREKLEKVQAEVQRRPAA